MDDGFFTEQRRRWTLRFGDSAKTVRGGQIAKLVGTVRSEEEPRVSPFLGRKCVAYAIRGSRVEGSGRSRRVIAFADVEWSSHFWLESESGRVLVEPSGWYRLLNRRQVVLDDADSHANLDAFSDRYGNHERAFFEGFAGRSRYTEQILEPGETVAVIGEIHEIGRVAGDGYRESGVEYAIRAPAEGRLWISGRRAHVRR